MPLCSTESSDRTKSPAAARFWISNKPAVDPCGEMADQSVTQRQPLPASGWLGLAAAGQEGKALFTGIMETERIIDQAVRIQGVKKRRNR